VANVVVTGGAGFLGSRLATELLRAGSLDVAGAGERPLSRLTIIDRAPVPFGLAADARVTAIEGDLGDLLEPADARADSRQTRVRRGRPDWRAARAARGALAVADVIFHLAAAVSAECEADFDLGLRTNLYATEALLATCRALGNKPVVVFASSVAVFGATADNRLPAIVDDDTLPRPQSSYGTQKLVAEYLLADYTRKGFLRGRAVRLMTVVVRPGKPNAAASGFLSAIIREPLAGQRATCPVDPASEVALASPARAIEGLLRAATSPEPIWGGRTAVNLPPVTVTVADIVGALERAAGPDATALIDWVPDQQVARIVTGWPARFRTERATRLGLTPDPDFDSIIAMHLAETAGR
jgi:D-erythronate 2-dehydrogenase